MFNSQQKFFKLRRVASRSTKKITVKQLHIYILIILLNLFSSATFAETNSLQTTRFGTIILKSAPSSEENYALLFSDEDGINQEEETLAASFTSSGTSIAIIDSPAYLASLAKEESSCLPIAADIVRLSQMVQKEAGVAAYQKPVITGLGLGATLAYLIAAQISKEFTALVSFNFCPAMTIPRELCLDDTLPFTLKMEESKIQLFKKNDLNLPWLFFKDPNTLKCAATKPEIFLDNSSIIKKYSTNSFPLPGQTLDSPEISAALSKFLTVSKIAPLPASSEISDSLIELPSESDQHDYFVLLLSGDGGWASIDREIAEYLVGTGVNVLGFDSLKYFWHKKTSEQAGADLDWTIQHYVKKWQKKKVFLVGFSLGADVLPLIYNKLTNESKKYISQIALLSPALKVSLEVHITDWFINSNDQDYPLLPELQKITKTPILCIYGSEDQDTICRTKIDKNIKTQQMPGDHHFDGDYQAVAEILLNFASNHTSQPKDNLE